MKKIVLTVLIALIGTAVLATDFGNYSSRRHPRNEGFVFRLEGFGGSSYYTYCAPSGTFALGDQVNPYLMLGGGIGWMSLYDYYYGYYDCSPVYFNARVYPINSEWSPYLDLKLGMDFYSFSYYYEPLYFSFGLGASWRNLDFGGAASYVGGSDLFYTFNVSYNFRF